MTENSAHVERVAKAVFHANPYQTYRWDELPSNAVAAYFDMARAAINALELTEEWSVQGHCSESSTDCDHFGEHGPWVCGAVADTREGAAAFPVASEPGAYLVSRLQSPWTPIVGATPVGEQ